MNEVKRNTLTGRKRILAGITLFSMFFGAGNLIFPPFLGAQAGTHTWQAFAGFAVSAVFLPILGVAAVTKSGGLEALASRVHSGFSFFYILVLYLAIGPCLAIPRTASTSFSIAVMPFWNQPQTMKLVQLAYSLVFFLLAAQVAMHPEKLTECLGKCLTPILLTLIVIVFGASVLHPAGPAAAPGGVYGSAAAVSGFLDGYQTMDTLAALNFGIIIAMNIRVMGVSEEKAVMKETIHAGWIAGAVLLTVYGMLSYVGMVSGTRFAGAADGTETLTGMVDFLFGKAGAVILACIFMIACFNTCVGLLVCCGNYFHRIFPKLSYRVWVYVFAALSMMISNAGLGAILRISKPVLNAIYPLAILLIFLSCIHHRIEDCPRIYPWSAFVCGLFSLLFMLEENHVVIPGVTGLLHGIPGSAYGFGWLIPTAFAIGAGFAADKTGKVFQKKHDVRRK